MKWDKEKLEGYNPGEIEAKWYDFWEKEGYFHQDPDSSREPYSIVMPPPNVTGQLHMGHALDNTLQDILIRFKRMSGYNVVWIPGTDHAGIATQVKVEEQLAKEEGKTRYDIGREEFLKRVWAWKEKYGNRIEQQVRRLGSSCDWSRKRFTMDDICARAVREVFVALYEKGLIYQGHRITNWCPHCHTALSDIEVDHKDEAGHLWYVKYPVIGEDDYIMIATTRPETIMGDTAVAVNPNDERMKKYIGKKVLVPLVNREVEVIADDYVDIEFGTGAVKITPAHDPNDFEMGERHNLESIMIMNLDGTMNAAAGKEFDGMTLKECRKAVVADLEKLGLLDHVEELNHAVGHCSRCKTTVEPLSTKQWFVKMKPLAEEALAAVDRGDTKFIPGRFTKIYDHWLENIQDWCISRQLWWGHQIPVWYCDDCGEVSASRTDLTECPHCHSKHIHQDPDVLDTWFSSALWPFSTMGWPDKTPDLQHFFPTSVLVTGYDIIFFWVARMIMAGYEYEGQMPFKNVYFTGIVRDKLGRKMSKSLGNSPDPLELIEKYGADGVRMGMMLSAPAGNDILFDDALCEQGRNFCNKIWNAFRLIKGWTNAKGTIEIPTDAHLAVQWFDQRLDAAAVEVADLFSKYRLSEALMLVYKLFWDEFSSWYLEMVKPAYGQPIDKKTYESTLHFFDVLLRQLHPFMPFITEELWQHIYDRKPGESIMVAQLETFCGRDLQAANELCNAFDQLKEIISGIRNIRLQKNIAQKEVLEMLVLGENTQLMAYAEVVKKMANLSAVTVVESKPEGAASFMVGTTEYFIPLGNLIDVEEELKKLEADLKYQEGFLQSVLKKLNNEKFVSKAPANVIEMERKKQADAETKIAALKESIAALKK